MELWPIWVPSKGRAAAAPLLKMASLRGLKVNIMVESQEKQSYADHHPNHRLWVLPRSDQGLAYSRQCIKDAAEANSHHWFWMLDDDISKFLTVVERRCRQYPMERALLEAQQQIMAIPHLGLAALEYQQFAWSNNRGLTLNSYCDVCVALNSRRLAGITYRPIPVKEDRDFCLQVLAAGYQTARIATVAFATPKRGSNKGGLFDEYAVGREKLGAQKLASLWPQVASVVQKSDGHWDAKIDWWRAAEMGKRAVKELLPPNLTRKMDAEDRSLPPGFKGLKVVVDG